MKYLKKWAIEDQRVRGLKAKPISTTFDKNGVVYQVFKKGDLWKTPFRVNASFGVLKVSQTTITLFETENI